MSTIFVQAINKVENSYRAEQGEQSKLDKRPKEAGEKMRNLFVANGGEQEFGSTTTINPAEANGP